jgi:hypothetical protein
MSNSGCTAVELMSGYSCYVKYSCEVTVGIPSVLPVQLWPSMSNMHTRAMSNSGCTAVELCQATATAAYVKYSCDLTRVFDVPVSSCSLT